MRSTPAALILFPLLSLLSLSCTENSRRTTTVSSTEGSGAAVPSAPTMVDEPTLDALASLICVGVSTAPSTDWDGQWRTQWSILIDPLNDAQRLHLAEASVTQRAAEACPEVIQTDSLSDARELPWAAHPPAPTGFFLTTEPLSAGEEAARLEWTAIGLGCLGLDPATASIDGPAATLLTDMGFTLDSYIQASLDNEDTQMADRIFRGVLRCARTLGVERPE